eukprot:5890073-Pyramimonas_sp.AAC.1
MRVRGGCRASSRAGLPATTNGSATDAERCEIGTSSNEMPLAPDNSAGYSPVTGPSQSATWTPPSLAREGRRCPRRRLTRA